MLNMRGNARSDASRFGGVFAFGRHVTRVAELENQLERALRDRHLADTTITDLLRSLARADQDYAKLAREFSDTAARLTARALRAEAVIREVILQDPGTCFAPSDRLADFDGVRAA